MGLRQDQNVTPIGWAKAEHRRTLDTVNYAENTPSSLKLPLDTCIKRATIMMIAEFDVTYAAGSPQFSELGVFSRLCPQIDVNVNGIRNVKSLDPAIARLNAALFLGKNSRRAYTFGAASAGVNRASRSWVAGLLAYPATTQFCLFNETMPISFEMPDEISYRGDKSATQLDIRDVSSAEIKFYFGAISAVQRDGVGATVTYGNRSISFITQIIENKARERPQDGEIMYDYVETLIRRQATGESTNQVVLNTGTLLAGLSFLCRNGDTNRTPVDNIINSLALKVNGSNTVQGPVSFQNLQDDNKARYGLDDDIGLADYASTIASTASVHPARGFAYMGLVNGGDLSSAINTSRAAQVDQLTLEWKVNSASASKDPSTFTNPVELSVATHEVRPFAYKA